MIWLVFIRMSYLQYILCWCQLVFFIINIMPLLAWHIIVWFVVEWEVLSVCVCATVILPRVESVRVRHCEYHGSVLNIQTFRHLLDESRFHVTSPCYVLLCWLVNLYYFLMWSGYVVCEFIAALSVVCFVTLSDGLMLCCMSYYVGFVMYAVLSGEVVVLCSHYIW